MINIKSILSIARAETRVTRRLARYWLFLSFSYLIVFIAFIYYSALHGLFSSYSSTAGLVSPRYLVSVMGLFYLVIYCVGVVFLAFDVRARDKREQMYEVLDSRPYTNIELVSGRFLGVLISAWVPILILVIILELLGFLLKTSGLPIGEPVEFYSILNFTFFMSLPALSFIISIVFLVTLLLRNRLAASVILLLILGGCYAGSFFLPIYKAQLFDFFNITMGTFPSDLTFSLITPDGALHSAAIFIASLGILGICAAVHPRLDDGSRVRTALGGIIVVMIGAAILASVFFKNVELLNRKEMWLNAHSEYSGLPVPDLKRVSGQVDIVPGRGLDLDIKIEFTAPGSGSIKNAVFTLNPGQEVVELLDSSGKPMTFTHENGLLDIALSNTLAPGNETSVSLKIKGIPDKNFAYLTAAVDPLTLKTSNANIALLGVENSVYDSNFVALMPALRWLPASGPETDRDNHRVRPVDYFDVDLNVRLPNGWLVAGPGKRNKIKEEGDYNIFRFSPPAVVPEIALIASEFENRSFEAEGVFMELLIHKKHMKNLEVLADTGDKVKEYITSRLKEAKEEGLEYPYDGFTLVEVPTTLRTYGGGWRMDTVQSLPGVMLLKELSLPTARFDSAFRNPEEFKNREGGLAQAKFERLQSFFQNDFAGGNVFTGVPRDFFLFQTAASGPGSIAVNFVMDTLSGLLISDTKGYFSAYLFTEGNMELRQSVQNIIISYLQLRGIGESVLSSTIRTRTAKPVIWEKILEVSLKDFDPWEDPSDSVDVLALKGYAVADSIYATLGREKTAALLANIRKNHSGQSFSVNDMNNTAKELGVNLDELLGDWIGSTGLPGFVVPETKAYRIADDVNGGPRYQLLFTVRNDEPVPGVFNFVYYYTEEDQEQELTRDKPVRLAGRHAIQYGTIVSRTPSMCFLQPYLSLNRGIFQLNMDTIDHEKIIQADLIEGVHEIPWEIPVTSSIIVDDLDDGFSVEAGDENNEGFRIRTKNRSDQDTDQGLPYVFWNIYPNMYPLPDEWSRISNGVAFGKYRHTTAVIKKGDGEKKALFRTSLPKDGAWDLEFYIPMKSLFPGKEWGTWHAVVIDDNGDKRTVEFDSKAGNEGWNLVGKLDLPKGKVTVELSDQTDGNIVTADAIRWTPAAGN